MLDPFAEPANREVPVETLLPVRYVDGFVVSLVYFIESSVARGCIPQRNLHPLVLFGRRSVVVVTLFDFRSSSIGSYREVSVGILASPHQLRLRDVFQVLRGSAMAGAWIVALPVNQSLACKGGEELFGFPKSVKCINVHVSNDVCSFDIQDKCNELLAAQVALGPGVRLPVRRLVTYSELGGKLLETTIPVKWTPRLSMGAGSRLRVGKEGGDFANLLTRLELPPEPKFVLHGGGFEGILDRPRPC